MDKKFVVHRTAALENLERRAFLKRSLSLGALAMLTGCELTDEESVQRVLMSMSNWNDGVQHWLFNPNRLAPEFPESRITKPFPFNAYYSEDEVVEVDGNEYKLELAGMIKENDGTDSALEWEEFGASTVGESGNMGVGEITATISIYARRQKGRHFVF